VVGRINKLAEIGKKSIIMMGPGRWGSSNIDLGVNVGYSDISNAAVLAEIAREEGGHIPDVSYGTHFFQDLVEEQIVYLPVYPDDPGTEFNAKFFLSSANCLGDLCPDLREFGKVVRVIDVGAVAPGVHIEVVADPANQRAVCFLERG
jgi:hypothetical protein